MLIVSLFETSGRRQIAVARVWARFLLWGSGVRVKVEGLEKIAPQGSYVFVSNHLSYMDTPVVLANIPVQFRFLAKSGLFKIPLLGTHLARAGHIPVPRDDARAAVKTMNMAAQVMRDRGTSLLIFPEGGRSQTGELAAFKEGAAYIAIRAGVSAGSDCSDRNARSAAVWLGTRAQRTGNHADRRTNFHRSSAIARSGPHHRRNPGSHRQLIGRDAHSRLNYFEACICSSIQDTAASSAGSLPASNACRVSTV